MGYVKGNPLPTWGNAHMLVATALRWRFEVRHALGVLGNKCIHIYICKYIYIYIYIFIYLFNLVTVIPKEPLK